MNLTKIAAISCVALLGSLTADEALSAINYRGLSSAEYQNAFNTWVPQGYRPTCIRGYSRNGRACYDLTLQRKSGPPWVARHGLSDGQFQVISQNLAAQGYVVRIYSAFRLNGRQIHAAYWERR